MYQQIFFPPILEKNRCQVFWAIRSLLVSYFNSKCIMIQNDILLLSMISYIFIHKPCLNEDKVIRAIIKSSFF